jgi:hypothetical protein
MGCTLDALPVLPMMYSRDDQQEWAKAEDETLGDTELNAKQRMHLHPDVSKIVHSRTYHIYEELRVLNLYRELCWRRNQDTTNPMTGDDPVCFKRQLYIDHQLETLSLLPDPWVESDWERAFRIATLVFTYPASMSHDPSSSRTRYPSLRLMGILFQTNLDAFWGSVPAALFWILFIGAFATQGYPERPWFAGNIVKGAMILGVRSWGDARAVLLDFFYLPWVHDAAFVKIWEEVEGFMMAAATATYA